MRFARLRRAALCAALALSYVSQAWAAEDVETFPTPFEGSDPRLAVAADGSLHVVFFSGNGLAHARMQGGSWGALTAIPNSDQVSHAKYNRPALALDPNSDPHVVWGPVANWTDSANHTRNVYYWNGSATSTLFDEYSEYVALGITGQGTKVFAGAVLFLPGDTEGQGVAWAPVSGTQLGSFTRFQNAAAGSKYVSFCRGNDNNLHLVWRFRYVHYARYSGGGFGDVTELATSDGSAEIPACAVDSSGEPHVVWIMWKDKGNGEWAPIDLRYASHKGGDWEPSTEGLVLRTFKDKPSGGTIAVSPTNEVLVVWSEGNTVWATRSTQGGESFSKAAATSIDNTTPADEGTNQPFVPLVYVEGQFQGVYEQSDGKLVRAVFHAKPDPVVDAGGQPDASAPETSVPEASVESGAVDGSLTIPDAKADGLSVLKDSGQDSKSTGKDPPAAWSKPPSDSGGCGCRTEPGRFGGYSTLVMAATLSLLTRRRRRPCRG